MILKTLKTNRFGRAGFKRSAFKGAKPLLPLWLAIALTITALVTVFLIVVIVRLAIHAVKERELTAEDILLGTAAMSASKLPSYDESKFIHVIKVPRVHHSKIARRKR